MTGNMNSRLWRPLTRLHPLLIILAALAVFTLAIAPVNAAPRQQVVVNICSRTTEVQTEILALVPGATCSTITDAQLAGITVPLFINGYSSSSIEPNEFEGLTGVRFLKVSGAIETLHPGAFEGLTSLDKLNLSQNRIKTLEEGVFRGLNSLSSLRLHENRLTEINPDVFKDLAALEILAIHINDITTLDANTFSGLTTLTELNVGFNPITNLHKDTFDPLISLVRLNLGDLSLPNSAWDQDLFDSLTNLKYLRMVRNGITALDKDIFGGLTKLETLEISENAITALLPGVFDGLSSLKTLHLNNNALTTLPADIFDDLAALEQLYLYSNSLSSLPTDVFDGLTSSLTILYVHRNSLSLPSLHVDVFDGLTGLSQLALSYNKLTTVPDGLFDETTALQYLYLNNNRISSVPENTFDGLTSLLWLYLSNNSLSSLNVNLFDETTALQQLYLHRNTLSSLDETVFDSLTALQQLYLDHNSLSSLAADTFDGLTALNTLYLNDNSLTTLDADLFDDLGNLKTLYLNDNGLTALPATLFEDLDNSLQQLVLTDNSLSTLPAMVFAGLTGLKGLDLSCNSLTALDLSRFDPFASSLTYLDITGNSFTTAPTDTAVRAKLTNIANLYISEANTECLLPDNVGLSGLTVSAGTLYPAFEAPGFPADYRVDVAQDATSIVITPITTDPHAEVTSIPADTDTNSPGIQVNLSSDYTRVDFKVTAENGVATKTYLIEMFRDLPPATNARLSGLTLSGVTLTEDFDSRAYAYTADVAPTVTGTTVTATPLDPDATTVIKLNGVVDTDGTVDLQLGENAITVEVIAEDGSTMRTYTVTVPLQGTVSFGSKNYYVFEGDEVEVTVELSIAPPGNASITFPLTKIDSGASPDDYTVPASITFGANEISASFTVAATQDTLAEDTEYFIIFLDPPTQGEDVVSVDHEGTLIRIFNDVNVDTLGITFTPASLTVGEGVTGTYDVKLNTAPTADVTVAIGSDNTDVTVSSSSLTFTTTNWNTAQTVTVSAGQDDDAANDTANLTHSPSGGGYGSGQNKTFVVTVTDDDRTGVQVSKNTLTVREEDTAGNSYTVALSRQPTADVTVTVAGHAGTDVTPSPTTLTFTSLNWATAQTVTVKAGNDADTVDDRVSLTHSAMSADSDYDGIAIASVAVTVTDNDGTGVHVSKTSLTVREEDTAGNSYTVALSTQPTANVTVTVAGHAGTDVTPSPTTLTFTSLNWETAQTVTVKAGDDDDMANDSVTLTHSVASTDTDYQGITISSVAVTVTDNDRTTPPITGGGGGGFGAAFEAPQFVDGFRTSRPLEENARPGDAVGDPVAATHPQNSEITYSLSGTDAARFTVDEETGQIRLGQAIPLELGQTYTVNLTGTDSGGTGAIIIVDIVVAEAGFHRYDLNKNGSIEKDEVLAAVADYFAARIEKPLVLEVVSLYFAA